MTGSVSLAEPGRERHLLPVHVRSREHGRLRRHHRTRGHSPQPVPLGNGPDRLSTANSPYVNTAAVPLRPGRYCFRGPSPRRHQLPRKRRRKWGGHVGTGECFTVSKINTQTATTPNGAQRRLGRDDHARPSIADTAVVTGNSVGGDPTGTVTSRLQGRERPSRTGGDPVVTATTSVVRLDPGRDGNTFTSSAISVAFTPATTAGTASGGTTVAALSTTCRPILVPASASRRGHDRDYIGTDVVAERLCNALLDQWGDIVGSVSFTLYDGPDCGIHKSDGTPGTVVVRTAETFTIAAGTASPVTKSTTNGPITRST